MGILTVIIAIALIMLMARKRINIGIAMFAGSLVLIVGTPMGGEQIMQALKAAYINPLTWELAGAVVLIGILGHLLKASGAMDAMVESLLSLLGDARWLMVVLPGLIGSLSVPGGAMMSAPIVDKLGDRVNIGPEYKTGINIIYRHIWYIIFPIIPSLILAASLAGLAPRELAVLNVPAMILGFAFAWFWLLQSLPGKIRFCWDWSQIRSFLTSILPLVVVITLYLIVNMSFLLALVMGILVALVTFPQQGESLPLRMITTGVTRLRTMILPGFKPQLILVVAGIMLFKELMSSGGLVDDFALDLVNLGIPLWLLLIILPLLVGFATGSHEAAVGIAIPVFFPLLSEDIFLAGIGLVYISATMGYLSSPLHLCIILTREYFNASFSKIYRYIAPVTATILLVGLITALVRGL